MPAPFPVEQAGPPGRFGPSAYADWRAGTLGEITDTLEERLILRLAGDVAGRSVLDVGCGDGALTRICRQHGARQVIGVDVDPRMVASARLEALRQHLPVGYAIAAAERLPFADDSIDLVTIVTVLAFMPEPDRALREIARVLRPGGILVLGDLGLWSVWALSRRVRGWLGLAPLWSAARFRSSGELRALVAAAGLRVERAAGAVYYPRCAVAARLLAPIDPMLGELTGFGAAFLALRAGKPRGV